MRNMTIPLTFLITAALALAGCAGDDDGDDGDGTTTTTTTGTGTATTTTTTTTGMEEMPPTYLNGTVTDLVSCTVVAAAVAAGAPFEPVSQASSQRLAPEDANRSYEITLVSDASSGQGGPALASLCVGFDGDYTFAEGNTGTIPEGATEMLIGGDTAFEGEYSVKIG